MVMVKDTGLKRMETEMRLAFFSKRTIDAYMYWNIDFLKEVKKPSSKVTENDIRNYVDRKISKGMKPRSVGIVRAALKFFYNEILRKDVVGIRYPKIPKDIPVILEKDEVRKMIKSAGNEYNRLIIKFLYSSGLRLSELLNLRVRDLDMKNREGWVRGGKGGKDRLFILSKKLIRDLNRSNRGKADSDFVFRGKHGRMSSKSIQNLVREAAKNAGLKKEIHTHTLRHTFANHLLENGVDIKKIQTLLGHSWVSTTQMYLYITNKELRKIKNPLDNL